MSLIFDAMLPADIPAIAAHVMPDNRASARVLEKLGFSWRRRALSDQPGRCSNGPMDRFELDRGEWYAQRGFGATAVSGASILPEPAAWSEKRAEA